MVIATLVDAPSRRSWDANIKEISRTVVEAPPGLADKDAVFALLHCVTNPTGPVSSRDFVDAVVVMPLPGGSFASGGVSVSDSRFPEAKGCVRGFNSAGSGWFCEPIPSEDGDGLVWTRCHYVFHSNVKGWLPHSVVTAAVAGSFVTFARGLSAFLAGEAVPAVPDAAQPPVEEDDSGAPAAQ